jgi:hypothetical protein
VAFGLQEAGYSLRRPVTDRLGRGGTHMYIGIGALLVILILVLIFA